MAGWLETAAETLGQERLSADEIDQVLDLARDVAHGTERRYAPLTAFLIGLEVAGADDRAAALREAVERLRAALPEDT